MFQGPTPLVQGTTKQHRSLSGGKAQSAVKTKHLLHSLTCSCAEQLLKSDSWLVQLLPCECVGAAVSPAGRGVEGLAALLLCYHNSLLLSPFSERFSQDGETTVGPGEPRLGRKIPKKAFNRLFHTPFLKYHAVGSVSVLLPLRFDVNSSKGKPVS